MHRSKAEVDKHVESLVTKLSLKEFKSRAYSIARLYYDAGDYASCRRYVEQYLSVKERDAAAHKLLGLALQQLGEKEKALEQFKTSLDIDNSQSSLILEICILLSDDEVFIDPGRARYWCERAQNEFPRHPATFNLRERLLTHSDSDPEALLRLLKAELQQRPRDAALHARLLKQHLISKNYKEAFDHSFAVEFGDNDTFRSNYAWYEVLSEVLTLDEDGRKAGEWQRRLLELTVAERLCALSLPDGPSESNRSLVETAAVLHRYDQEIHRVTAAGATNGGAEFHSALLRHHQAQFSFYAACYLLKKAKKEQLNWREAVRPSSPLFLIAWHAAPLDQRAPWLSQAPEQQRAAARRWHLEASYRCSQAGHCLLAGIQEKSHTFVDRVSQVCSGNHWKDKVYEKLFTNKDQLSQSKSSHFLSDKFENPTLRLPRRSEVQAYDVDAQKMFPSSLHHQVWMLMNYKSFAQFKCVIFDMLRPGSQNYPNCGPETLNRSDVEAFVYTAALTAAQQRKTARHTGYQSADLPELLPAIITDQLCSPGQMKWWDCAVKVSRNEVGTELSDIRAILRRGIEVVRCIDNHGLDPQLLCKLAAIFSERAQIATSVDDKENWQARASLYYTAAIPLLERLKSKITIRLPEKRMFEYSNKELSSKEILSLIEESKLYIGEIYMNEGENEKAIDTLTGLKSARSSFLISKIFMKMAFDEIGSMKEHLTSEDRSKHVILLSKAKDWAYTTADRLKCNPDDRLQTEILTLIEKIEKGMSRIDPDMSNSHEFESKYSSDENVSSDNSHVEQAHRPLRTGNSLFRNVSSTPKHRTSSNSTHYKSAIDSHMLDSSRSDRKNLERIESQIKSLHKKDCSMNSFMEHTKSWIEENRQLGAEVRDLKNNLADKIISKINTNIQDTVDQFKQLKLSVDQVKDKIGEYRNECRSDVGDLKKEVAELKKEITKLKSSAADQTIDESDLYNLEDYQANEATPAFSAQLPFSAQQVLPGFNQRVVPPVALPPAAYSIYGQNLYTLYNQFAQLSQIPPVPPASLFDPARPPYPGVFPPTEYPDVPHFQPPVVPPVVPPPVLPTVNRQPPLLQNKEIPRSMPANVVITSSDPMPTHTSAPQPVLSVTIPPQHLKNSPHNYQIPLPTTGPSLSSNAFNSGMSNVATPASKPFAGWGQTSTLTSTASIPPTSTTTPKVSSMVETSKFSLLDSPRTGNVDSPIVNLSGLNTSFGSPNISANKSRTLSEKSNTSIDYDPCPDFKPIIPLPDEIKVKTGEEDEIAIFSARAKLYRYSDKQWKERGLGELKLLKHKTTDKVRVLMRREQIHKICANHVITPEMELTLMKNETKAYIWVANDFADELVVLEKFCVRFKTVEIAKEFYDKFEKARKDAVPLQNEKNKSAPVALKPEAPKITVTQHATNKQVLGGFTFSSTPAFKDVKDDKEEKKEENKAEETPKVNLFSSFNFKSQSSSPFANIFTTPAVTESTKTTAHTASAGNSTTQLNTSDVVDEFEPSVEFKPVIPLPALVEQKTGEEDETVAFEHRAKLLRYDVASKEWKERGLGNIKILVQKENHQKVRLLMRREIVMKVCCNHRVTKDMKFQKMPNQDAAVTWCAKDFSEGELNSETFCLRFKTSFICNDFLKAIENVQSKLSTSSETKNEDKQTVKPMVGFGDQFKPKPGSWSCQACYTNNLAKATKCIACETPKVSTEKPAPKPLTESNLPVSVAKWGDKFKPKAGSWECSQCLIRNDAQLEYCSACENPKDPSMPKKETKSILNVPGAPKFSFGIPAATTDTKPAVPTAFGTLDASKPAVAPGLTFGTNAQSKPPGAFTFGIPQKTEETSSRTTPFGQAKTAGTTLATSSPFTTPAKDSSVSFAKESGTFDFVMKPKTKGKSPLKSPEKVGGDDSDNEKYEEDEGHHIHFTPVIPLPEKVEVNTGEENEVELYSHRAKLFRFVSGEWKERGLGNVKILKHKDTGKLRVLMRREQIHKICLNHALTPDVIYTNKDDKSWHFTANDFSEGEISFQQFCLRFKSKEIADEFKQAIEDARNDKEIVIKDAVSMKSDSSDEVVFISEIQATDEEKQKAKDLMLPENFFTYKNKQECMGCRGCESNEDKALKASPISKPLNLRVSTPNKSPFSVSPSSSIFTTPTTVNRTSDVTLFQTPMGGSDESLKNEDKSLSVDKENSTPNTKINTSTSKPALLATPKLAVSLPTSQQNPSESDPKALFGQAFGLKPEGQSMFNFTSQQKPAFGSLFSQKTDNTNNFGTADQKSPSIFGSLPVQSGSEQKPPLFGMMGSNNSDPKSIFGATSVFGANNEQKPESKSIFGSAENSEAKSVFGNVQAKSTFGAVTDQKSDGKPSFGFRTEQTSDAKSVFGSTENATIFGGGGLKPEAKSIFASLSTQDNEAKSVFGGFVAKPEQKSIFGTPNTQDSEAKSVFGGFGAKPEVKSIFGSPNTQETEAKSVFGGFGAKPEVKSIFGAPATQESETKSVFGGFGAKPEVKSIFGSPSTQETETKPVFGQKSIFGFTEQETEAKSLFGTEQKPDPKSIFGLASTNDNKPAFGSTVAQSPGSIFSATSTNGTATFGGVASANANAPNLFTALANGAAKATEEAAPLFSADSSLSFAALSSNGPAKTVIKKSENFKWEGAGQKLFGAGSKTKQDESNPDKSTEEDGGAGGEEEYDPHYEPIVPLPDKIVVTTGEEDEEKLFGERAKLYRYDEQSKEWKERGVGEMKLLHHPARNTYRLLLRREQVHKAVLNMLLHKDVELLPMKNSETAWTWAAMNYAETPAGVTEALACRFKNKDLATTFRDRVVEVVRKLQVVDAQAYREQQEAATASRTVPQAPVAVQSAPAIITHEESEQDVEEHEGQYEDDDEYDEYYDEEDHSAVIREAPGAATVTVGDGAPEDCDEAVVQLLFDQEVYAHKLLLVDGSSGEILVDNMVVPEMPVQMEGDCVTWTGYDLTGGQEVEKTVNFTFASTDEADEFYEAVQNCKGSEGGDE